MNLKPTKGRCIVEVLPKEKVRDGLVLPESEHAQLGVIVAVDDAVLQVGDTVVLPQLTGRRFEEGGKVYFIYLCNQIPAYIR